MVLYQLNENSEFLRHSILPNKNFFIIDLYKTLILWNQRDNRNFLRDGTIEFLESWGQKKVLYSDAPKETILNSLEEFNLNQYFSRIYTGEDVNFNRYSQRIPQMHKFYEEVTIKEGFKVDKSIVIEDFLLDSRDILSNHQIDFIIIPVNCDKRSNGFKNLTKKEYLRERKKVNGFSFKVILPLEKLVYE